MVSGCKNNTPTINGQLNGEALSGSKGFELKAAPVKLDLFPVYLLSIVLDSIAIISMFEDRKQCQKFFPYCICKMAKLLKLQINVNRLCMYYIQCRIRHKIRDSQEYLNQCLLY